jgi:hypothetical protein
MDPNTNTPIDPNEPLPLGGPLHPKTSLPPEPEAQPVPSVVQPQAAVEPSLPAQAFVPNTPSPLPPAAPNPYAPPAPGDAFAPTQPLPSPPMPAAPPAPGVNPAFDAQSAFNPQLDIPAPVAPVVVSGGFAPNAPIAPGAPVAATVSNPAFPAASVAPLPPPNTPPTPSKGHRLKALLIVLAGLVVLGGGSAAAYFAVVVPNKPANVLKTAVLNSINQNSVSYIGTVNLAYKGSSNSASTQSYQLSLSGSKNTSEKASDATVGFEGYGIKFSLEARLADQNLYLKTGDLSTLAALAGSFVPSIAPAATTISKDVSNQWFEVDSSLLNAAGVGCYINNADMTLSQADLNLISSDYTAHGFVNILKTANGTANGQPAEEFVVSIDDDKAAGFVSGLGQLSTFKSLDSCKKGTSAAVNKSLASLKGDNKQIPLTLWVSKASKQVIRVSFTETAQEIAQTHTTGTAVVNLGYNNVSIPAPANAESVLQLYTKLAPTLSGLDSSGLNFSNPLSSLNSASSAATTFLKH